MDALQIQKEAQFDPSQTSVWLLHTKRDGSFSKALCVDALEDPDFRLCELSSNEEKSEKRTVTFYFRATNEIQDAKRPQDLILLFCIFMDPRKRKMKYIGSITVVEDFSLHSLCFGDICALSEGLRHIECSFFCVHPGDRITQIRIFQKTIKEVRLSTASGMRSISAM